MHVSFSKYKYIYDIHILLELIVAIQQFFDDFISLILLSSMRFLSAPFLFISHIVAQQLHAFYFVERKISRWKQKNARTFWCHERFCKICICVPFRMLIACRAAPSQTFIMYDIVRDVSDACYSFITFNIKKNKIITNKSLAILKIQQIFIQWAWENVIVPGKKAKKKKH